MIEEALQKFAIESNKYYKLTILYKVLYEVGLTRMKRSSFTTDWWERKINQGTLILPEKQPTEKWKLSGKQIREIVFSFAPEGKGSYDYRDY